jgi:hypothetical protein
MYTYVSTYTYVSHTSTISPMFIKHTEFFFFLPKAKIPEGSAQTRFRESEEIKILRTLATVSL